MGIIGRLEDIFAAAAFAEAGEHGMAKQMLKEAPDEKTNNEAELMAAETVALEEE